MVKVNTINYRLVFSFILFIGLFLTTYIAQAQESTSTSSSTESTIDRQNTLIEARDQNIEARTEARENRLESRQVLGEERQAALSEIRQQRIINLSANISNRMDAAVVRMFTIIERLEARIAKMQQSGFDTNAAEAKLREAASSITSARALLGNIDTLVTTATTSEQPVTKWGDVRATYQEIARLIRSCHQSLRETIFLLKESTTKPTTASSTVEEIQ